MQWLTIYLVLIILEVSSRQNKWLMMHSQNSIFIQHKYRNVKLQILLGSQTLQFIQWETLFWHGEAFCKAFLLYEKYFVYENLFLYKICADQMVRWYNSHAEEWKILHHYHSGVVGEHFSVNQTVEKILEAGFICPSMFHDSQKFVESCYNCQQSENLTKCYEMRYTPIQQCEVFDVWGINFI